jgi:hypothetical protein
MENQRIFEGDQMATSIEAIQSGAPNEVNTLPTAGYSDRKLINISFIIALLLLYFLTRFLVGKLAIIFLLIAAVTCFAKIILMNLRAQPIVFWIPTLLLALASMISLIVSSDTLATYAIFTFAALFFHASGYSMFSPINPRLIIPIVIVFIISVIPFIAYPELSLLGTQPVDAAAEVSAQLKKFKDVDEGTFRIRAYFYHSAELGQFATSLFIVLSQTVKYYVSVQKVRLSSTYKSLEIALYIGLIVVVQASDSRTANVILALTLINRFFSGIPIALVGPIVLVAQFFTQIFFADKISAILQSGSFWWRYDMAQHVLNGLVPIRFWPHSLGSQSNWPHSIFLDFALVYGLIGPFILFLNQLLILAFRQYRGVSFGWSCLFLVVVATNPVGASAVYIVMAIAFAYAERVALEISFNRNLLRQVTPDNAERRGSPQFSA